MSDIKPVLEPNYPDQPDAAHVMAPVVVQPIGAVQSVINADPYANETPSNPGQTTGPAPSGAGELPAAAAKAVAEALPFDLEAALRLKHVVLSHDSVSNGGRGMWQAVNRAGQHGDGHSPEEAVLNIGSTIVPNAQGRRVRVRLDGSEVALDQEIRSAADADAVAKSSEAKAEQSGLEVDRVQARLDRRAADVARDKEAALPSADRIPDSDKAALVEAVRVEEARNAAAVDDRAMRPASLDHPSASL